MNGTYYSIVRVLCLLCGQLSWRLNRGNIHPLQVQVHRALPVTLQHRLPIGFTHVACDRRLPQKTKPTMWAWERASSSNAPKHNQHTRHRRRREKGASLHQRRHLLRRVSYIEHYQHSVSGLWTTFVGEKHTQKITSTSRLLVG